MSFQLDLQLSPSTGSDTRISSSPTDDSNYGGEELVPIGSANFPKAGQVHRFLIRFDISQIPADACILDAAMILTGEVAILEEPSSYRAIPLTRNDWTEYGATWNVVDGQASWTTPGGDVSFALSSQIDVSVDDQTFRFDVAQLVRNAIQQEGVLNLLVRGEEDTTLAMLLVASSDSMPAEERPRLVVNYLLPPKLEIIDHGDATGATAQVEDVDVADSCEIWIRSFSGQLGQGGWTLADQRLGSGNITLDLPAGHYFAYALLRTDITQLVSEVIYFSITDGLESVHTRCLEAAQARIRMLNLEGLENEQVLIEKLPTNRHLPSEVALPAIVLSPTRATMPVEAGTNSMDDVRYDVLVTIFDRDNQEPSLVENLERHLLWRQQIARAFRNQRLPGVPEIIQTEVEPDESVHERSWKRELMTSMVRLRFISREVRGF